MCFRKKLKNPQTNYKLCKTAHPSHQITRTPQLSSLNETLTNLGPVANWVAAAAGLKGYCWPHTPPVTPKVLDLRQLRLRAEELRLVKLSKCLPPATMLWVLPNDDWMYRNWVRHETEEHQRHWDRFNSEVYELYMSMEWDSLWETIHLGVYVCTYMRHRSMERLSDY